MSRALARLRTATGDPLLVRAGRALVPTPRALALREQVADLVRESEGVLRPARDLNLGALVRTFTLRSREGFVENFGPVLVARARAVAPGVRLCFVQKLDKESAPLREGVVDLETGVVGKTTSPELRARGLFRDRYVGVVQAGHPLSRGKVTAGRFAGAAHVRVSRRDLEKRPIDEALKAAGRERDVITVVDSYSSALALARASDLVATVPERQTGNLRAGMFTFPLPFATPEITISLLWHPRLDGDPAHRWLRGLVIEVCAIR
jgi:DNA-binding transcriptional LysR family regulator